MFHLKLSKISTFRDFFFTNSSIKKGENMKVRFFFFNSCIQTFYKMLSSETSCPY